MECCLSNKRPAEKAEPRVTVKLFGSRGYCPELRTAGILSRIDLLIVEIELLSRASVHTGHVRPVTPSIPSVHTAAVTSGE